MGGVVGGLWWRDVGGEGRGVGGGGGEGGGGVPEICFPLES